MLIRDPRVRAEGEVSALQRFTSQLQLKVVLSASCTADVLTTADIRQDYD